MNKRELVKFLKDQKTTQLAEVALQLQPQKQELIELAKHEFKVRETAEAISSKVTEAYTMVTDWRDKHKVPQATYGWNSFDKYLKDTLMHPDRVIHTLMDEINVCLKPEMERLEKSNQELKSKVAANYSNLIAVVEQSASAKEAEEYLTSLGFVIPVEKKTEKEEKAIPKVDVSFLFINKGETND